MNRSDKTISENELLSLAREAFQDEELGLRSSLTDAVGYDSLTAVQFLLELETRCRVRLAKDDLAKFTTVMDILEAVRAASR